MAKTAPIMNVQRLKDKGFMNPKNDGLPSSVAIMTPRPVVMYGCVKSTTLDRCEEMVIGPIAMSADWISKEHGKTQIKHR